MKTSPCAAQANRGRNADNVSRAHAGGCGNEHCLKRRNVIFVVWFFADYAQCLAEQPQLHTACSHGEIHARNRHHDNQNRIIHHAVNVVQNLYKIHSILLYIIWTCSKRLSCLTECLTFLCGFCASKGIFHVLPSSNAPSILPCVQ